MLGRMFANRSIMLTVAIFTCFTMIRSVNDNFWPLLITEKSLLADSGGPGRYRGGPGQRIGFQVTGEQPVAMTIRHEGVKFPPRGLLGGGAGAAGRDLLNGQLIAPKGRYVLQPGYQVLFDTPGGGGFGAPEES